VISDFIVYSALVMAGLYCLCWLSSSSFRRRIEAPKHRFLAQLQAYDQDKAADQDGGEQHHVRP
jgi:hypothetical protein